MIKNPELQKRILAALDWDPSIDASEIGVAVRDGVVTLTGTVPSYTDLLAAERSAKRIAGVKGVACDLQVRLPGDRKRSDTDLAQAAIKSLEWNGQVPHQNIQVRVADAWVTLEGRVDWQFQREAAERAVRYLQGVRGVTNSIALVPRASPGDLKNRIEAALKRHAELEARKISVSTRDGSVVLEGSVHSWAEREEAEAAVWASPGIRTVEDRLKVAV
jgi:osmotically-inducible protein OsmY